MSDWPPTLEPDRGLPPRHSLAVYVRLWREPSRLSDRPVWRGSLQAIDETVPRYFSSMDEMLRLLRHVLERAGPGWAAFPAAHLEQRPPHPGGNNKEEC